VVGRRNDDGDRAVVGARRKRVSTLGKEHETWTYRPTYMYWAASGPRVS
jgi:hypothetical protein